MEDKDYYSHLYEIANQLNKEYSLDAALRKSLEKTVEILGLETGWIWLTEPNDKSVYLAASYNLPPALSQHPERLAGWCYCIQQYLSDDIDQAVNISEIACSRLQDIGKGTKGLKFHATIPLKINNQKVGLMNLLSAKTQQFNEKELTILNTISELIGTAIQRTRLQQSRASQRAQSETTIQQVLKRVFRTQMKAITSCLHQSQNLGDSKVMEALERATDLSSQLSLLLNEIKENEKVSSKNKELQYPSTPLTKRELEVLNLVQRGLTNSQIGQQLYIAERTVKFHITSILSKLNAGTRTEAVDIGLRKGLIHFL